MIIGLWGYQGSGKTYAGMRLTRWEHLVNGREIVSNVKINDVPGDYLGTKEMREFLKIMVEQEQKNKVVFIDEIDAIAPGRLYSKEEQLDMLLGLWHDEKLDNTIIYTTHKGKGADKIIRDATSVLLLPKYDKKRDTISIRGCDMRKDINFNAGFNEVSEYFERYNRWALVKRELDKKAVRNAKVL